MARIQCKMCGGILDIPEGMTAGICPYCESLTTFPKLNDAQTENLYRRAEHFRQKNDFDKAEAAYEAILDLNSEDPEAYWGLLLSRYGIEYVEDPATHERIPTCHRVQYESILADSDYRNAMRYALPSDRDIYEREAARIAEIQKDILQISAQEKPYDVFICYKEATDGGTRTKDSALAQDIYFRLTNQGLKVFFARITLEDKLGQKYEPYIFAALNSAKVMLVIGTKREYFDAVWVKNEWSRFLALMKKDRSKLLIPCYKDMDAYDIPEELSMFQSQDMGQIGFMQDLLHGIMKVLNEQREKSEETDSAETPVPAHVEPCVFTSISTAPSPSRRTARLSSDSTSSRSLSDDTDTMNMEKRIPILMLQGEWDKARDYCEKVLETDPENPEIYLYLCMIDIQVSTEDELRKFPSLANDKNFRVAMHLASPERKEQLEDILDDARRTLHLWMIEREENEKSEKIKMWIWWIIVALLSLLSFFYGVLRK